MASTILLFAILGLLILVFGSAALGSFKAAPWVPTFQRDVRRMLELADLQRGETLIDLGSGDGRFVIAAARDFGARAIGYELSLLPYLVSQLRVVFGGLRGRVQIRARDFLAADLSMADVITIFLTPMAMTKLSKKFAQGLKPGCRIVSIAFPLPDWTPEAVNRPTPHAARVFLYRVPPGR